MSRSLLLMSQAVEVENKVSNAWLHSSYGWPIQYDCVDNVHGTLHKSTEGS